MRKKNLEIYINIKNTDIRIGFLFVDIIRGKEVYSFEYDNLYLKNGQQYISDPDIIFTKGRQYKKDANELYCFLKDLIPDRWAKNLIIRKENRQAKLENRNPEILLDSDFLVRINDFSRIGSIRIKENNQFVSAYKKKSIPTIIYINKLEQECYNVDSLSDEELKDLFEPGSSLGGARPKACIFDNNKELYIAKFSNKTDEYNVPLLEKLNNDLAKLCNLNVPESKIIKSKLGNDKSIFIVKRFDRNHEERFSYVSMMSLLNAKDGENEQYSYLDLVDVIKKYCIHVKENLTELYKRLIFNMVIRNSDDHLRNHGLINYGEGYELSPLFDINTSFFSHYLTLTIDGFNRSIDFNTAIEVSKYFGLTNKKAMEIISKIKNTVIDNAPTIAKKLGVDSSLLRKYINLVKNDI